MSKHTFTESDLRTARKLRESGTSWDALGAYFGCDHETIRRQIDPEYRKVRSDRYKPQHSPFHVSARALPRKDVAARLAEIVPDTRSRVARWMGDPPPGRSALDRRTRSEQMVIVRKSTVLLAPSEHGVFMEDRPSNGETV